ncbi:MAG: hypothetical protein CL840_14625 [Crocinitomicaceae bacterium]|nr:hypothetical protein [Crocinitomicaceae bacterium]|tara:strand:- start:122 stop:616 length:495 start_codon:yes stop_codon:yes gene_type:complete
MNTIALLLIITLLPASFGPEPVPPKACDKVPKLNQKIIEFVDSKIKKKVGRGECWDLAFEALSSTDAKWDGQYKFGKEVFYRSECIFPGDIIQFERVKIKYEKDGITYNGEMAHHTAIIYEVKEIGVYTLAHQNTAFSGRKVGLSELDVKNISKGKFKIYRPVN